MNGLLDFLDTDEGRLGLGLLAAAGPRRDGMGTGGRIQEAFAGADARKRAKAEAEWRQMQMEEQRAMMAQRQQMAAQAAQNQQAVRGSIGSQFNPQNFMRDNPQADMAGLEQAMKYNQMMNPARKFETVAAGSSVYEMGPDGPKLSMTAPSAPKNDNRDAKITQYEYAKQNGYRGSFEQFVTLGPSIMAGAMAPLRAAQVGNIVEENAYNLPPRRPQGGGVSVTANGRTFVFPDQKSANNFKLKAGVQ